MKELLCLAVSDTGALLVGLALLLPLAALLALFALLVWAIKKIFSFMPIWIEARAASIPIGFADCFEMHFQKLNPREIFDALKMLHKAGIEVTCDELQNHVLSGGHLKNVRDAAIAVDNCGRFLQYNQVVFYIGSCISLSLVGCYLHRHPGLGPICFVMVAGAIVGLLSVLVLRGVDETSSLRESSRQPVLPQLRHAFHDRVFLKLLLANFCLNLSLILAVQNQVLALKRSYGVDDWTAMLFSLVMCAGGILFTYLAAAVVKYIGPRKILLISLSALAGLCLLWWIAPAHLQVWRFILLFAIAGGCGALFDSCVAHYFLCTVPQENQVICSICNYLLSGAGAGAVGMFGVGALLRHLVPLDLPDSQVLGAYQSFYAVGFVLCLVSLWTVAALPPLPMELRVPPRQG